MSYTRDQLYPFLVSDRPGWVQSVVTEGEDSEEILPFGEAPDWLSPREARELAAKYLAAADFAEADRERQHQS